MDDLTKWEGQVMREMIIKGELLPRKKEPPFQGAKFGVPAWSGDNSNNKRQVLKPR